MGYYTRYSLEIEADNVEEIQNAIEDEDFSYAFNDECKWYEHQADMREFSKRFPDALFVLHGVGEEFPDVWYEYYRNGTMQRCDAIITYPPFDEAMLR